MTDALRRSCRTRKFHRVHQRKNERPKAIGIENVGKKVIMVSSHQKNVRKTRDVKILKSFNW